MIHAIEHGIEPMIVLGPIERIRVCAWITFIEAQYALILMTDGAGQCLARTNETKVTCAKREVKQGRAGRGVMVKQKKGPLSRRGVFSLDYPLMSDPYFCLDVLSYST
ncbi:MAG: hypothetical protein R6T98_08460 [Desulfatiglandales bacterium]